MHSTLWASVRVVFFDALGTLLRADPSVGEVYSRCAHRYGLVLTAEELTRRFESAFAHQRQIDRQRGWRTSESREYQRWRAIVREVFLELGDTEPLFVDLWHYFARADSWSCYPEVADVLERLQARGYGLGLASNFDKRLRAIVQQIPCFHRCSWLVISSEIGWLKPARDFFEALVQQANCLPQQVLYVGDDYQTDCLAALHAGLNAAWLARLPSASVMAETSPASDAAVATTGPAVAGQDQGAGGCPVVTTLEQLLATLPPRVEPYPLA